jgi:arylsulfatase A-like enzyme
MNFHEAERFRPMRAMRDARWKLIHNLQPDSRLPEWQLFDLLTDAMERTNLAGRAEFSATQSRLTNSLRAWRERTRDPLLHAATLIEWAAIASDPLQPRGPYLPPAKAVNAAKKKNPATSAKPAP